MKTTAPNFVDHLEPDEVFVFGSNGSGFHGAGSAGYAMRGDSKNTWRQDKHFCAMINNSCRDRRGKWAIFGVARGYQIGLSGRSYAIQTVERPGHQGNIKLSDVGYQLRDLILFAKQHPELKFLVCKLGATRAEGGYSYFGLDRMARVWELIHNHYGVPGNILLPERVDPR